MGIEGSDCLVTATSACYGIIKIPESQISIVQMFYVMPRINVKLFFDYDLIKLMQIRLKPHPKETCSITKDEKVITHCLLNKSLSKV